MTALLKHLPDQVDSDLSTPSNAVVKSLGNIKGHILVLGAGGKMGLHVTRMIHEADRKAGRAQRVTAVSRFSSIHGRKVFEEYGIPTLACDLEETDALDALPSAPNIVFMAGAKFGTGDQPDLLERMNVLLPQRIADRFAGSRFLVFSSGCVYSMVSPSTGGSTEEDATEPPGDYARSCLQREQAFIQAAKTTSSPVALIRLNYATEYRYGVLVDIAQKVFQGQPVDIRMGWVNVIWQRDAVDHILQAFPLATTEPFFLNVTGDAILSVKDLAHRFGDLFDREPTFTGEEQDTAWLNCAAKSHELFGKPLVSLDEMLERTAAWIRSGEETFGKPTGFDNREGKF